MRYRIEKHIWKKSKAGYDDCKTVCHKSSLLYNACIPIMTSYYEEHGFAMNLKNLYDFAKHLPEYSLLPKKVSAKVIFKLIENFKAFTNALKSFYKNPSKFKAKPQIPKQLKRPLFITTYDVQAVNTRGLNKGTYRLSGTNILIKSNIAYDRIKEIKVVPKHDIFEIQIVYKVERIECELKDENIASIDLGINNLCVLAFNGENKSNAYITNGKSIKSINQHFNKTLSKLQSELPTGVFTSKRIKSLYLKRDRRIIDYFHKASRQIVNTLITKQVITLVIGYNEGWKQNVNLGKKTNQKFTYIPHLKLIRMLEYKCELVGIKVVRNEESYTSKCSFFDGEVIKKHKTYKGNRKERGLFITSTGLKVNADLNGAYNIMVKVFPNAFAEGIMGAAVHPKRGVRIN